MNIRSLIAIGVTALACLAFSPAAFASSLTVHPDICVLDLSRPTTADHAMVNADLTCHALQATDVADAVPIGPGDEDEAAGPLKLMFSVLDYAGQRLHFDPGRIIV